MAVMGERLPEAWVVEMHRNGRVEFPLRRWAFGWVPVVPLLGTTVYLGLGLPEMLDDGGWRYVGYLITVLYVGAAGVVAWQLVTQRPRVVVDRRGIHRGRRHFVAWSEISSIGAVSGPSLVRRLRVLPRDVRAKDLVLSQHHVNDLGSFRVWLNDVLAEQRQLSQEGHVD